MQEERMLNFLLFLYKEEKMKAFIGITGSIFAEENDSLFQGYERAAVSDDYVSAVEKAGGIPIVLPIVDEEESIKEQVARVDAIVLSGGYDIDPIHWGEEISPKLDRIFPRRDAYELKVIRYAREMKKPILGICRGHQILNVAFGGSLYQDIFDLPGVLQHVQKAKPYEASHSIQTKEGSFLREVIGESRRVNSYHHLAVKDLGKGLEVSAVAPDGIVEGIEYHGEDEFIIGVQFHPEMMHRHEEFALNIFKEFIKRIK